MNAVDPSPLESDIAGEADTDASGFPGVRDIFARRFLVFPDKAMHTSVGRWDPDGRTQEAR